MDEQAVSQVITRRRVATRIGNIDYERIWNGENIPKEFFCPICSCLLWQPRSCGSCQNLFCESCISKWIETNMKCPFGCQRYEDRRCSPQIRCLLSNIWIRCQSAPYGCTDVLSYDTLEEHQTNRCPYPSTLCQYCDNLMPMSAIKVHEQECGERLGNCSKCNRFIPLFLLQKHQLSCVPVNLQQHLLATNQLQNLTQPPQTFQPDIPIQNTQIQIANLFALTLDEREIQQQYYNLVWWRRFWSVVQLILTNPFNAPYILLIVWKTGWGCMLGGLIAWTILFFSYCFRNICIGFLFIILLTGLLHAGVPLCLNSIDDTHIMIFSTILFLIVGSSIIYINAHLLNKKSNLGYSLLEYMATIFLWKLALLIIRFYFNWIPAYVTATFLSGTGIFIALLSRLTSSPLLPT